MPIKSYLAIPKKGQAEKLKTELRQYSNCEINAAENLEVMILLTDTPDEQSDKKLFRKIQNLESVQMLTLVSAFSD